MHKILISSCLGLALVACSSEEKEEAPATEMKVVAEEVALFEGDALDATAYELYGAGVHQGETTDIAVLLTAPKDFADQPVRVRGPVFAVCQHSGCWVMVGSEEQKVRVLFKDGDFVLPKDSSGEILMEGVLEVEEISVEEQKRFLVDEGKAEEAAKVTAPELKLKFIAHGVALPKGA